MRKRAKRAIIVSQRTRHIARLARSFARQKRLAQDDKAKRALRSLARDDSEFA